MDLRNQLPHLPPKKQVEIAKALDIILDVVNPEKVILFGSYAKGKWVDDITVEDGGTFVYRSDFDFLVVTKDNSIKEYELKSKIENRTVKAFVNFWPSKVGRKRSSNVSLAHRPFSHKDSYPSSKFPAPHFTR